jgi:hypothetical protein
MDDLELNEEEYTVEFIDDKNDIDSLLMQNDELRGVYEDFMNGYASDRF